MFNNFDYKVSKIFARAESEMLELKHPYVGSEHLLLSILKNDSVFGERLKEYNLEYETFKAKLIETVGHSSKKSKIVLYTPLLKRIIDTAINYALEDNKGIVTINHLLLSLLDEGEGIAIRIMISMEIDLNKLYKDLSTPKVKNKEQKQLSVFEHGLLMNDRIFLEETVVGREREIDLIIETLLRKNKNNPLLIGKAGVGKTAIVEELVRRIETKNIPLELQDKYVVSLEMGTLVAGTKYRGEFEEKLNKIISEVVNEANIILFIDEVHTIMSAGGAEGAIDAASILKPYLARGDIKCIGATTTSEYYKYIAKDKALSRRFQVINVDEPDTEETKYILNKIKDVYGKYHNIRISKDNINSIVEYTGKYIRDRNNPDKCIDVLDSVCAKVKIRNNNSLLISKGEKRLREILAKKESAIINQDYVKALKLKSGEDSIVKNLESLRVSSGVKIDDDIILSVIEAKSNIPIMENKKEVLKKIKDNLNSIYGQEEAKEVIVKNIKRKFLMDRQKPLSLLLVGPTGVGKTQTVLKISEALSRKKNLVRIDMNEYNLETSVNKLIGVSQGYIGYDDEYVFSHVRENPYSVILIDEIEKASRKVLNLFLNILDEGFITDGKGEKIYFNDTLIFMTSNLKIKNNVGFNNANEADLNELLSKELLGRIDETVYFKVLSEEAVIQYIRSIEKNITKEEISKVLNTSNYQEYGMRNVKKTMDNLIEELRRV